MCLSGRDPRARAFALLGVDKGNAHTRGGLRGGFSFADLTGSPAALKKPESFIKPLGFLYPPDS
jgi:hypothetical protein